MGPLRRLLLLVPLVLGAGPAVATAAPTDPVTTFGTSGVALAPFTQGPSAAEDVAVAPDGKLVAVGQRILTSTSKHQWVAARFLASGAPDPSFNGNGRTQPLTGDITDSPLARGALAVAVRGDGSLLVVGQATGANAPIQVVAVGTGGQLVPSGFGSAGVASLPLPGSTRTNGEAIAVQPDGRILVAGHGFVGGHEQVFLARFLADGTPDGTFDAAGGGGAGRLTVPAGSCDDVPSADCTAFAVALTSTGSSVDAIYVGGLNGGDLVGGRVWKFVPSSGQSGFALAGSGWGDGTLPGAAQIPRATVNEVNALLPQLNGSLVAGGYAQSGPSFQCGLVRLTPVGTVDATFGTGGAGRIDLSGTCLLRDLVQQADGRFVFAGQAFTGAFTAGDEATALGRFDADGRPDATFAPGGAATVGGSGSTGAGLVLVAGQPLVAGGVGAARTLSLSLFAGGDLPAPGGGGGEGGEAGPPPAGAEDRAPSVEGRPEVGQPLYCDPGVRQGAASFEYTWIRLDGGNEVTVATGQVYSPTALDSGHPLECFVTDRFAAAASGGRYSSNQPTVLLAGGVTPIAPAMKVKVPRFVESTAVCRRPKRYCKSEDVRAAFTRLGLPVDIVEKPVDPDAEDLPASIKARESGEVIRQSPAAGATATSINGKPVKITLTVLTPPKPPRRSCPVGVTLHASYHDYTLPEVLTGMSPETAEQTLKAYGCVKIDPKTGDTSKEDYVVEVKRDPTVTDAIVKSVSIRTKGQDVFVLNVSIPASELALLIKPDPTPGALTIAAGQPTLTVDPVRNNTFLVAPQTPAGIGLANVVVELRDGKGRQLDAARTDARGVALLRAEIETAGTYTIVADTTDPQGDSLTGAQTIGATDRRGAPFTTLAGYTLTKGKTGYARGAFRAAALTNPFGSALKAQLSATLAAQGPAIFTALARATADQKRSLNAADGAALRYVNGLDDFSTLARQGFAPTIIALGGKGPLRAGDPVLAKGLAFVETSAGGLGLQSENIVTPGSGVLTFEFHPTDEGRPLPPVALLPDGTFNFQVPGGNILAGPTRAVGTVLDTLSRLFNVAPIISNDGASLLSENGLGIVSTSGAGIVSRDGAGLAGSGANLVGNSGGTLVNPATGSFFSSGGGLVVQASGNVAAAVNGQYTLQGAGLITNDGGT